ncbi:GDP-Man:Man(3)GlcNAc(2)-PP-Dol alpha-1,2-mannosyltransferase [Zalerion maritima]|uniref:GDP-Man:Man(3)GlcNAc(2)-PP-Dol alpha-1,2-mannosyltransferase n=1 Tax=Zalerion maritima TaxID=339359 RepID=A0AAD5RHF7_9PEZI|nr:GDP-Man:Man(3)GlcNAc(2)-PP-Dol alpha-1,2-mannosyltransferase [Zalerion maritima]
MHLPHSRVLFHPNYPIVPRARHENNRIMEPSTFPFVVASLAILAPFAIHSAVPAFLRVLGRLFGWYLRKKSEGRKHQIINSMLEEDSEEKTNRGNGSLATSPIQEFNTVEGEPAVRRLPANNSDWDGVVGFLHPFCNAGGGGERVLWAAIRATQEQWPKAKCVVYTGDHGANKQEILDRARFNIHLYRPTICFLYLTTRDWVLASRWPHFTLLGQSFGSVIMVLDALSMAVPDIFIDTMGYAFAVGFCKFLFRRMPTCAYVHYPTISTDMLDSLNPESRVGGQGINAGQGVGLRGVAKWIYWMAFAKLYSRVGASVDVVMTNSSWTQNHIQKLWGPYRRLKPERKPITVVYPPVSVKEMESTIQVSAETENRRKKALLYIAQFRPEKNHELVVQSFAELLRRDCPAAKEAELMLVGSVRDDGDSKRVYQLRLLVNELHIKDRVKFRLDASWEEILEQLGRCSVGVNGMWNEHFGIGVVEYQAAGLIVVAHDSGGPKMDIVIDEDDKPTGYHATTVEEFANAYEEALSLPERELVEMRLRARRSSRRFTEEVFARNWTREMEFLVGMVDKKYSY